MDFIYIGPTPPDEPCQQVGIANSSNLVAMAELQTYMNMLERHAGEGPGDACLRIKWVQFYFGRYGEIVARFNPNCALESAWAYKVEGLSCELERWDEAALAELEMRVPGYAAKYLTVGV